MTKEKKTIVFTFKESLALNRMVHDIKGTSPLNGRNAFENRTYMERDFFKKLAQFDAQKDNANFIDVNSQSLKEVSENGSISATLFNLYADDSLKEDFAFARDIIDIEGQNLLYFDFSNTIKNDPMMEELAFLHDSSLDGKVFQQASSLQEKPRSALLWITRLYQTYQKAGFDPYQQITAQVFEQKTFPFATETLEKWCQDADFRDRLTLLDPRFDTKEIEQQLNSKEKPRIIQKARER